jgi:hypothetical protein
MKYSILLSTLGNRETLETCLNNFLHFVSTRNDTELVIGTSDPNLTPPKAKVLWYPQSESLRFYWKVAAEAATGEWVIIVADDTLLSKNFLERCDQLSGDNLVFQPSLLDPQGYVVCGEYWRSYTIAAVRRKLVAEYNLGTRMWCDTEWLAKIFNFHKTEYYFDTESFCYHYGYNIEGGIPCLIRKWDARPWIMEQRKKFKNRQIDVSQMFIK